MRVGDWELRSARAGARARLPALAVAGLVAAALTVSSASAGQPVVVGSTSCSVSFTSRSGNFACTVRIGDVTIDLGPSVTTATTELEGAVYRYDVVGRLVSVASAPGESTSYSYDELGRIVAAAGSRGGTTRFVYDDSGRIQEITGLDGDTLFTYDAFGRVSAVRDAVSGETNEFVYDDAGRPVQLRVAGNNATLGYDRGRLTRVEGPTTTSYSYDARGTVASVLSDGEAARFVYDTRGNVSTIDQVGAATQYSYDRAGRVTEKRTTAGVTTYTYDARSRLMSTDAGTGETTTYDYETNGALSAIASGRMPQVTLEYAAVGTLSGVVAPTTGAATDYRIDEVGRLLEVTLPAAVETVIDFESGTVNEPYVVGDVLWESEEHSMRVSRNGRLLACDCCP